MKTCYVCKKNKPQLAFYPRYNKCAECSREYSRTWSHLHLEYTRKRNNRYRKNNPDKVKNWKKLDYEKHREKRKAKNNIWRKEHPEIRHAEVSRRRAIMKGSPISDFTLSQWESLIREWNYKCAYCGKRKKLSQDHVVPLSRGGSHTKKNIVPACISCNSKKSNKTIKEAGMKFI